MGDDTNLEIAIKLSADAAPANAATAALNETGDAAKRLQSIFEGTKGAVPAEAFNALEQSHKKSGQAAQEHGGHLHALHRIFHALNEVVPGLGLAMQAAFSPIGAVISLAVMALRLFHEKMKEVNEEMRKMEEENAKPLTHTLNAQREAVIESATSIAGFNDRVAEAARGERTMKEKTEEASAAMKLQVSESGRLEEALKQKELGQLDLTHDAGLISDAAYYERKLALEEKYQERKRALAQKEELAEMTAHEMGLKEAEAQQKALHDQTAEAHKKSTDAQTKVEALPSLESVSKRKEEAEKALKEFEGEHPAPASWFAPFGTDKSGKDVAAQIAHQKGMTPELASSMGVTPQNYETWASLKANEDRARTAFAAFPKDSARVKVEADLAKREEERAEKRELQNTEFIAEEKRQQAIRVAKFKARSETDEELDKMGKESVQVQAMQKERSTSEGQKVLTAAEAADSLKRRGIGDRSRGRADWGVLDNAAKELFPGKTFTPKQEIQMFGGAAQDPEKFERMRSRVEAVEQVGSAENAAQVVKAHGKLQASAENTLLKTAQAVDASANTLDKAAIVLDRLARSQQQLSATVDKIQAQLRSNLTP